MSITTLVNPVAESSTVAVLGCGWLGMPLAKKLLAQGHRVLGSTTTAEQVPLLAAAGIEPQLLQLGSSFTLADEASLTHWLSQADTLVLNVPPRAAVAGGYPTLLRPVHRAVAAARLKAVLFVSTTGVYPDEPRIMRETDAISTRDAASDVLRTEGHFVPRYGQWQSSVVRLGGLFGPDRAPGRFLAGRRDLPQGDAPTNLLHLTDAVGVLSTIIGQQIWGHTLNVCALQHPRRRDFYPAAAAYLGLEPPTFQETGSGGKTIDSSRLRALVPYAFQHDDVLAALPYC
ncbi:NAD(P)-binding domain-containing protein [Hymenobacter sp. BRD67]|uniref:NAD(P)-binding domain-containing protein n=1 Tax=Hymenobacter sp. BRD67 TaxID=2675877 RepID=UPI001566414F|nr:NAD(P)-binding domain-containing protein [Hymenobacter sp. BRD67]QKG52680.1 SDR family NAD(P)-dependent oxidoreductase [Hymenobacter sp. BRD67]